MTVTIRYEDGTLRLTGDVPRDLSDVMRDERTGDARTPAVRYAALLTELDERGVDVDDDVFDLPELDLSTTYDLRSYQREAVDAWREADDRGVVELPTGSGKTVVGVAAAVSGSPLRRRERCGTDTAEDRHSVTHKRSKIDDTPLLMERSMGYSRKRVRTNRSSGCEARVTGSRRVSTPVERHRSGGTGRPGIGTERRDGRPGGRERQ